MLVSGVSVVCVDAIDFKLSVSVVSVVCIDVIVILSFECECEGSVEGCSTLDESGIPRGPEWPGSDWSFADWVINVSHRFGMDTLVPNVP